MLQIADLLLTNQQGGPLAQMSMSADSSPENKTLGAIVVHTVAALSVDPAQPILLPLVHMLTKPSALSVSKSAPILLCENLEITDYSNHSCQL